MKFLHLQPATVIAILVLAAFVVLSCIAAWIS